MSRAKRSFLAGVKDISPIILGVIPFGLVTGAAIVKAGFGLPEAIGMSLLVNAGASQLAATSLFMENAPLLVVIATALIINARMIIYSTSIAPEISHKRGAWTPLLGHMLVDQSYAVTMTRGRFLDVDTAWYYAGSWVTLASVWQVVNVIGVLGGAAVPASWSLDFVVPLVFLSMLGPVLAKRVDVETAVVTAVAAAVLVPLLPMQLGLVGAIVLGIVWGAIRDGRSDEHDTSGTQDAEDLAGDVIA